MILLLLFRLSLLTFLAGRASIATAHPFPFPFPFPFPDPAPPPPSGGEGYNPQGGSAGFRLVPIRLAGTTAAQEVTEAEQDFADMYGSFKKLIANLTINSPLLKKEIMLNKIFNFAFHLPEVAYTHLKILDTWRFDENMDKILAKEKQAMAPYLKKLGGAHTQGKDKYGRPVIYAHFGAWPIKTAIQQDSEKNLYERIVYYLFEDATQKTLKKYEEQMAKKKVNKNKVFAQFDVLANFKGWSAENGACTECLEIWTKTTHNLDKMYPGMVHRLIYFNTPWDFNLFLDVVIPLDATKRITINTVNLRDDYPDWRDEMTKLIDEEVLKCILHEQEEGDECFQDDGNKEKGE